MSESDFEKERDMAMAMLAQNDDNIPGKHFSATFKAGANWAKSYLEYETEKKIYDKNVGIIGLKLALKIAREEIIALNASVCADRCDHPRGKVCKNEALEQINKVLGDE